MSVRFKLVVPAQSRVEALQITREYLASCWFQINGELPVDETAQKAFDGKLHLYDVELQINDSSNMVAKD